MTIPASKLRSARLAAAEVFIAEGLHGTNWHASALRNAAEVMAFWVKYPALSGDEIGGLRPVVELHVDEMRGEFSVAVEPRNMGRLTSEQAVDVAARIAMVAEIARKVEAAIAEASR
jgi:hypothetical protein